VCVESEGVALYLYYSIYTTLFILARGQYLTEASVVLKSVS